MKTQRNRRRLLKDVPSKANTLLNLFLIGLIAILVRGWHLTIICHDQKLEESKRPQRRLVIEPAKRGTIRDRFNIPLAINKMQYNATLLYSQIRQIPSVTWENRNGKKIKRFKRKEYIQRLSEIIARELELDQERLVDEIHAKAALYFHLPYTIKRDITEKQYYKLKMIEKDWPGLFVQRFPKRSYPFGKIACDLIGYMGPISKNQYNAIASEIHKLRELITQIETSEMVAIPEGITSVEQLKARLNTLENRAYSIHDYVGKSGIEAQNEKELRGLFGKKYFFSDARGNYLRELPGSTEPLSGNRILLSISKELQEFAELLLIQNEKIRKAKSSSNTNSKNQEPWIKGGSIIAMDPNTGEILALASYPRFNPNDFIASGNQDIRNRQNDNIRRWFETDKYIGKIWDRQRPLERETSNDQEESVILTWETYLNFILPENHPIKRIFSKFSLISHAIILQDSADELVSLFQTDNLYAIFNLIYSSPKHSPYNIPITAMESETLSEKYMLYEKKVAQLKAKLDPFFYDLPGNYDKVLLIDLCRLAIPSYQFTTRLKKELETQSIEKYLAISSAMSVIKPKVKQIAKKLFHSLHFSEWRKDNEVEFLNKIRRFEKEQKQYAKPYLEYLDKKEEELFELFWKNNSLNFLFTFFKGILPPNSNESLLPYYKLFSSWAWNFQEFNQTEKIVKTSYELIKKEIESLHYENVTVLFNSLRSYADLNRTLYGTYPSLGKTKDKHKEKHLASAFYPTYGTGYSRSYGYRQAATPGSLFKLVTAYEALQQRYTKHPNEPLNPLEIIDRTFKEGKTQYVGNFLNGKPIPQYYHGGYIPKSLSNNIGKIDLIKALEVSSNPYFSLLAEKSIEHPVDLEKAAHLFSFGNKTGIEIPGEISGKVPDDLDLNKTALFQTAIGQHTLIVTPLQTAVMLSAIANGGKVNKPLITYLQVEQQGKVHHSQPEKLWQIPMVQPVRDILIEGMRKVFKKNQHNCLYDLSRLYADTPDAIHDYLELKDLMAGKTSTAEVLESLTIAEKSTEIFNHVWFGGILFDSKPQFINDPFGKPELIVIVYLRYGNYGKEAIPIACQIANRWRKIRHQYERELKQ